MLLECSDCHEKVSDKACACPHCGAPIAKSGGLWGCILTYFQRKQREKIIREQTARKQQEEAIEKKRELQRKIKEAEEFARYKAGFTYASKPYTNPRYVNINCAEVHYALCQARSYDEVRNAVKVFDSDRDAYRENIEWLIEWSRLDVNNRMADVLFATYCLDEGLLCNKILCQKSKFSLEIGLKALCKLANGTLDMYAREFIDLYINLSPDACSYYQKNIKWLPIIESHDQGKIGFFTNIGLRPVIGDEGLVGYEHQDWNKFYVWLSRSPLSQALDEDNIARIEFLLKWGANPNQYLYCSNSRQKGSVPVYGDPLLCHVNSKRAYILMKSAGMVEHPIINPKTTGEYNLIDHLWRSKLLSGKRLELLNYLYSIGYDASLVAAIKNVAFSFKNGNYHDNAFLVEQWLTKHGYYSN